MSLTDQLEAFSRDYATAFGIQRDDSWFLLKLHEEVGELTQAFLMRAGQGRAKGLTAAELDEAFRSEVADVLGQLLVLAGHFGIDLEAELARKWLRPVG
ncbi:MAG TPA: pyrophosphatase [Streptosporangiaceae bacterium]